MDDKMTPMEAEVLEMPSEQPETVPDSYGTAPRPKPQKSHVGLWVSFGLIVIGLCTFSVVASVFNVRLGRNGNGGWSLSMPSVPEDTQSQNPVRDLQLPQEDASTPQDTGASVESSEAVYFSVSRTQPDHTLSAAELYQTVSPGVVCLEVRYYYGTQYLTGVVISDDGTILSAAANLSEAASVEAYFSDGASFDAQITGLDRDTGVCLLQTSAQSLTPLSFADAQELQVGSQVYCVANPYGTTIPNMLSAGMLSGRQQISLGSKTLSLLQTSAELQGTGYGIPVFDAYGRIVGMTTAVGTKLLTSGTDPCFAISSSDLQEIVADLSSRQAEQRIWLGFEVGKIPEEYQILLGYPDGLWITGVGRGTRVEGVLEPNDIILSVNGVEVSTIEAFEQALDGSEPGDFVPVILYRNGKRYYAEVPVLQK